MKTYDRYGRLLGAATDQLAPIDVTASYELAPLTVTAPAAPAAPAWYAALLEPPTVYYVAAGLAILAWILTEKDIGPSYVKLR